MNELIEGPTNERGKRLLRVLVRCLAVFVLFLSGCASMSQSGQKEEVMAMVNGEPVTRGDLVYSIEVAHRREDLSGAGTLSVSDYMEKLIDDMLVIEEARRMGLEQDPAVVKAMDAYILRESVVRLHKDEILDKMQVTEGDLAEFYKEAYEFFTLEVIETATEEKATEVVDKLKEGGDFRELAKEYSVRQAEGETPEIVLSRLALSKTPEVEEAVLAMKPDETSGVIKSKDRFFIVKFISRKEADLADLDKEHVRRKIEKLVKDEKEEQRSQEYIATLREQATMNDALHIDQEVLSAIDLEGGAEDWKDSDSPVVRLYDKVLTAGDIVKMVKPEKTKEDIVDNWIGFELINHEALLRHYEAEPQLSKAAEIYRKQILKDAFIRKVILPKIMLSEKILEDFYSANKERFTEPPRYRIQQITVKSMEEAQDVMKELEGGADFSWVAKNRSVDGSREAGGNIGWVTKQTLPREAAAVVDSIEIGDISPILTISPSTFRIIRLQSKEEGKIPEFKKIQEEVLKKYFEDQFNSFMGDYVAKLREGADIRVNEKAVRAMEETFKGGADKGGARK